MLVPGIAAAPLFWLGVGPILIYNLVLFSLSFFLSGVGVRAVDASAYRQRRRLYLLQESSSRSLRTASTTGRIFNCSRRSSFRFHSGRSIACWIADDCATVPSSASSLLCQLVTCMYYGLLPDPGMVVVCGTLLIASWRLVPQRIMPLLLGMAIVIVAMVPVSRAYLAARSVVGERGSGEVVRGSATPRNYLAPPDENALFGTAFARFS